MTENKKPENNGVVSIVERAFSGLDNKEFCYETQQIGHNLNYSLYKHDAYVGTYRIRPGEPGGSIQFTDDEELGKEWLEFVFNVVWKDLQTEFGKFPWNKDNAD